MKLEDLVNSFTPDEFHDDPRNRKDKNGKPLQVLKDPSAVYKKLRSFGVPFSWEPVAAGVTPAGRAYFAGKLTLVLDGKPYTLAGVADEDHVSLPGTATVALQNALLRGYGAAEYLYDGLDMPDTTPASNPPQNVSQAPSSAPAQSTGAKKGTWNRPNNFKTNTQSKPKASGPPQSTNWDGTEIVDFGKHKGKAWNSLPNDYLQFITSGDKPNQKAGLEITRRLLQNPPDLQVDGDEPWSN